jgi:hypothetical protein
MDMGETMKISIHRNDTQCESRLEIRVDGDLKICYNSGVIDDYDLEGLIHTLFPDAELEHTFCKDV